ncbi:MAG TPA: aldo/keto reductase [Anaerolineales bacterium]|jgi:diketogulonate reductase-like aldo/keto reductase|nr:aldo/keto reductase [Anaerolineales bacterium]
MQPTLRLTNGFDIPQMGFGTYGLRSATQAILHALKTGYRHLDTADIYDTHENVGEAIQKGGIPREEIYITTKLWSHSVLRERVAPSVDRFLSELQTEYIDLLLIHWPGNTPAAETLAAMDEARKAGKVKSIGVSNFDAELMQEVIDTGFPIVNNQIEYNLNHHPQDVLDFCNRHKVTVTAYSPLERGDREQEHFLSQLVKEYSVTREEVLLRWLMQKGMIVIPRSSNTSHIESNYHALEWELDKADVSKLDEAD